MNIRKLLETAIENHRAGHIKDAERIYQQILKKHPDQSDALHLLGVVAYQMNDPDTSIRLIRKAISINKNSPEYNCNLGNAFRMKGEHKKSANCYREAIRLNPDYAEAYNNLGASLKCIGQHNEAIEAYNKALAINPDHANAYCNLGNLYKELGDPEKAKSNYKRSLDIQPHNIDALKGLGDILPEIGEANAAVDYLSRANSLQPDNPQILFALATIFQQINETGKAIELYNKTIRIKPDYTEALNDFGTLLIDSGNTVEGIATLKRALELKPDMAVVYYNIGRGLINLDRISEAEWNYKKSLEIDPEFPLAWNNLAGIYTQGRYKEAIASYRTAMTKKFTSAIKITTHSSNVHSNLLFAMHYAPTIDARQLFKEHRKWNENHAIKLNHYTPDHKNDRSPDKRLRIGYLSPDFRVHPVAYFILAILGCHDKKQVETFCYSNVDHPDQATEHLKEMSDHWREIFTLSDQRVSDMIQDDKIDILVDLSGHTAHNRLILFAGKPAPVQVTYLGYPNTTGLDAMDYRITDTLADPPGKTERFHSERLIRLPGCFLCYIPPKGAPDVKDLSASTSRNITFGSFNNRAKITPKVVETWSKILHALPGSRMIIKAKSLVDNKIQNQLIEQFQNLGISKERLSLMGFIKSKADHFKLYNQIDIALDTFPYNGTTTTCEALWMGVPVLTLKGDIHCSRVGYSILNCIGLPELTTETIDKYISKAVDLANNIDELKHYRRNIRSMMQGSPLMDAEGFTHRLEKEYRTIWQRWCCTEDIMPDDSQKAPKVTTKPEISTEIFSQDVESIIRQGEDLFHSGKIKDARDAFLKALKLAPGNTSAINNLGVTYHAAGEIHRAMYYFDKAISIDPGNTDAMANINAINDEIKQGQNDTKTKERPEIRVILNLPASGSQQIVRQLRYIKDIVVLQEVHPLGANPMQKAIDQPGLFNEKEIQALETNGMPSFDEAILSIYERCRELNKTLIIIDSTHLDFLPEQGTDCPSYRFSTEQCLNKRFKVISTCIVRNPVKQWSGMSDQAQLFAKTNIDDFIEGSMRFAEYCHSRTFIRFEDFEDEPEACMLQLCDQLNITYDTEAMKNRQKATANNVKPGDNRPEIEAEFIKQVTNSPVYSHLINLLGYNGYIKTIGDDSSGESTYENTDSTNKNHMPRSLHIGGIHQHPDWEIFNALDLPYIDHIGDARDLSRFMDNTFDRVYASHVLEHFDYKDGAIINVLKEWHRVLKTGGKLYISVPNLDNLATILLNKKSLSYNDEYQVMRMIFGGHTDEYDYHLIGLNRNILAGLMQKAGFKSFTQVDGFGLFSDTSTMHFHGIPVSLNVIAEKPVDTPDTKAEAPNDNGLKITIKGGIQVCVPSSIKSMTTYILLEQEDWFEDEIHYIRKFLGPGMKTIDIGANHGLYTLTMSKITGDSGRTWAFEPTRSTAALLEKSISVNRLTNIDLIQAGVSDKKGTAMLALEINSELNYIAEHPDPSKKHEGVELVSLDDSEEIYDWDDMAFIKIDAEGQEHHIIEGGKHFLSVQSPLIMFELQHNNANTGLIKDFSDLGYRSYRLMPGLNILVPIDSDTSFDQYQLNLFCCKTDRAKLLEQQGLLITEIPSPNRITNRSLWKQGLQSMPYFKNIMELWNDIDRNNAISGWEHYETALNLYVLAHTTTEPANSRCANLFKARDEVSVALDKEINISRLLTYIRILIETGQKQASNDAADIVLEQFNSGQTLKVTEPFLAVSSRFDHILPDNDLNNWIIASILEYGEKTLTLSSYFTGKDSLNNLELIKKSGFYTPEMERRRQLIRICSGIQTGPESNPILSEKTPDNLNPWFWQNNNINQAKTQISANNNSSSPASQNRRPSNSSKPQIRILHNMARSGGTVICKCLASMKNIVLLSEIHPLGLQWFDRPHPLGLERYNPIQQACKWFGLVSNSELQMFQEKKDITFEDAISLIYERCRDRGQTLVIRDWSYVDFIGIPFTDKPTYLLSTAEALSNRFEIIHSTTVRHPIDQWLSLRQWPLFKEKVSTHEYLRGYLRFAEHARDIGFIQYEAFANAPEKYLETLCSRLSIKYDPAFIDNWWRYKTITGDTDTKRGAKKEIKPVPRRKIEPDIMQGFKDNSDYNKGTDLLGYTEEITKKTIASHIDKGSGSDQLPDATVGSAINSAQHGQCCKEIYIAKTTKIDVFDDDIFLVSYPRSGNTWLRFLLASIIHTTTDIGFNQLERYAPDPYLHNNDYLLGIKRPRIIKSHEKYNSGYPNVVYLYRDVRDVVISFYYYLIKQELVGSFDEYFNLFIDGKLFEGVSAGSWLVNVQSWLSNTNPEPSIIAVKYEDMLNTPEKTVCTILENLHIVYNKNTVTQAIEKYTFKRMSALERSSKGLHHLDMNRKIPFIRKGTTGQWQSYLTQKQIDILKERYGDMLIELGYESDFDW